MKRPWLKIILLAPVALFALLYIAGLVAIALDDTPPLEIETAPQVPATIAVFGASGTAGDGILKAALADPDIEKIHVITRRSTERIDEGVASGKVVMTIHMDYLDYSAVHEQIAEAEAVFWAIGLSSVGVDEETYGMIHVDFPVQFVKEWTSVSTKPSLSFHYISSSDISDDSSMMWAREKVRAENTLFGFAEDTRLKVIAYRPDYIGPTEEEAHLGQDLLYWFFAPVKAAIRAQQIGQAMIEVTARDDEFSNGDKLGTWKLLRHSDAYEQRLIEDVASPPADRSEL